MKHTIIALLVVATVVPVVVNAQTNSGSVNRETLLQLITSLQKQIALLSEQLALKKGAADRCTNISGIQTKVPEGLTYSRTYEKCLTERELDNLDKKTDEKESKETACTESEDEVSKLREQYTSIDDKMETIKSSIPKKSRGTSMLLSTKDVSPFLAWIKSHYTPTGKITKNTIEYVTDFPNTGNFNYAPIGEMRPSNGGCRESGCDYSGELIQLALKVILLETEKNEINTKLQRAENEEDKDCD